MERVAARPAVPGRRTGDDLSAVSAAVVDAMQAATTTTREHDATTSLRCLPTVPLRPSICPHQCRPPGPRRCTLQPEWRRDQVKCQGRQAQARGSGRATSRVVARRWPSLSLFPWARCDGGASADVDARESVVLRRGRGGGRLGLAWCGSCYHRPPSPTIHRRTGPSPVVQQLAVPAYAHPVADRASSWAQLSASPPGAVGIVVANVANGPGSGPEADWAAVIHRAQASGGRVLGYVDTGYLGSPSLAHPDGLPTRSGGLGPQAWLSQIEADIDAWYQFYGADLGGIFLDEGDQRLRPDAGIEPVRRRVPVPTGPSAVAHPGALTVLNPGVVVPRCYGDAADVLVTFEGSYANYTGSPDHQGRDYEPLHWTPQDPGQIWHIVYGAASSAEMEHAMALSRQRGAGYVYVTDAGLPNPFGALPPADYWSAEVAQRAGPREPRAGAREPGPVAARSGVRAHTAEALNSSPSSPSSPSSTPARASARSWRPSTPSLR